MARLVTDYDLDLDWRGFELHPETPRGGMAVARLFPRADLDRMMDQLRTFAEGFGVTGMARHSRLPNTRRVLRSTPPDPRRCTSADTLVQQPWRSPRQVTEPRVTTR